MESDKYLSERWEQSLSAGGEQSLSAVISDYEPENVMVFLQPVLVLDPMPYLFFLLLLASIVLAGCRCAAVPAPTSPPEKKVCEV